tara:strand:- start:325 stop:534 length:210 start_codon:yes stop_codon:yes gene_type:complete
MESNQDSTDNSPEIINRNEKVISNKNLNYFYPNSHLITHQMRWFNVSLDKDLRLISRHRKEDKKINFLF